MSEPRIVARIEGWYLQVLAEGPHVRSYRIVKDEERYGLMESTIVTEAAGHLTLSGDCTPIIGGGVSTPFRYGLEWFANSSSPNYLGEKFLQGGYCTWERAVEDIQEWIDQASDYGLTKGQVESLQGIIQSGEGWHDPHGVRLYDAIHEVDDRLIDDMPGNGYHARQLRLLCLIQERFSKLWAAREQSDSRVGMLISLDGMLGNAVRDLETYEKACEAARESCDTSELPDPQEWPAAVQNADSHRCTLVDHLLKHLGMVREGLRAGDDTMLRKFFDLYVIDGTTGLKPVEVANG